MNLSDTDMTRSNGSRKLGLRPANPMPQLFVFVASCLSNQLASPVRYCVSRGKENATNARYLMQCWVRNRKTSSAQTADPK